MAGMKEIREHIASVKNTQKVTNAMYLIASTKMRRAREDLARTRPFFDALSEEIGHILRCAGEIESPYFSSSGAERKGVNAYLVITADRGLAGAYNQNVIQETLRNLSAYPDNRLFVVGENGRHFFAGHGIAFEQSFHDTAQHPTLRHAREIAAMFIDLFNRGEIAKLFVTYTDFGVGAEMHVETRQLLPLKSRHFSTAEEQETKRIRFEPSAEEVLAKIVPAYVTGFLYAAVVDSFCAEQNARAAAMDAANQNVEELLRELTLEFNHERQSAITQEITEVSAGARSREHTGKEAQHAHR